MFLQCVQPQRYCNCFIENLCRLIIFHTEKWSAINKEIAKESNKWVDDNGIGINKILSIPKPSDGAYMHPEPFPRNHPDLFLTDDTSTKLKKKKKSWNRKIFGRLVLFPVMKKYHLAALELSWGFQFLDRCINLSWFDFMQIHWTGICQVERASSMGLISRRPRIAN